MTLGYYSILNHIIRPEYSNQITTKFRIRNILAPKIKCRFQDRNITENLHFHLSMMKIRFVLITIKIFLILWIFIYNLKEFNSNAQAPINTYPF